MKYCSSLVSKLIYVMRINDRAHANCLKVGEATVDSDEPMLTPNCSALNKAAKKRINQYTQTAGIAYELLHTELEVSFSGGKIWSFNDKAVHDVLMRSGIRQKCFNAEAKADEWFITDLETVKKAIAAVREGRSSLKAAEVTHERSPVVFRPEQEEAIEKTVKQFKRNNKMLWNAKMRFGKTLSALQVVRKMNFRRTLILTHRPVVNDGWFEDFEKIFYDRKDFAYGSKTKGARFAELERQAAKESIRYVYFASMQDLRGSERTGGKFDKNDEIFDTRWDLIIVDEAHEGTQTELGQNVLTELEKDDTKVLELSGTPFNLLHTHKDDEIFTWDYVMEQKAKTEWDAVHHGDPNPYADLPRLNIFTFDLGEKFAEFKDSELAFNFQEFFRVDEDGEFVHRKSIKTFLDLLCLPDKKSNYPFSTQEYRENFRHSFWRIPGVKEGKALSAMLKAHPVFGQFEIVNVAGEGDDDEKNEEALRMVRNAIEKNDYTITLSCGRLTTGVTVPQWTAVFMLAGSYSTSASSYMQTIFRVQSPAMIDGKRKEECFVFDFAPDRTLKVLAEAAKVGKSSGGTDGEKMGAFLNFCPVISCTGTAMVPYDAEKLLGQLKRVYAERVVQGGFDNNHLYNDDLLRKLTGKDLSAFDGLKKIIGTTKAMPKTGNIDINNQGFTDEQYDDVLEAEKAQRKKEELTPEQKKLLEEAKKQKKQRDSAISILRGISIRMPLMIYGAELKDESQPITIDNFAGLIDESSWEEFMPRGVTKEIFESFKKYYEPDVFREAGKKIREMAKAADNFPLEERIERITTILSYFHNTDKETVLTPWRVVNMHLGDSIGGYVFYDEAFENVLTEPRRVDQGKVTADVYTPESRILEINSKTGLYPLYMAYSFYRARMGRKTISSVEQQHRLWDQVLAENIFIVCKTPMAKSITMRTLAGFRKCRINAHYFEDLVNLLKNKPQQFIDRITSERFWNLKGHGKMNFQAVVGNPPYQTMANGEANGSDPIYHLFIDSGCAIGERCTFIHPGRFLFNAGKTPKEWNEKMLNSEHYKVVKYWANSADIFPSVNIMGGLAVTYWCEDEYFRPIRVFVPQDSLREIINKVVIGQFQSLTSIMEVQSKFNFTTLYRDFPHYKNIIGSNGADKRLRPNAFVKLDIFSEKKNTGDYSIHGLIKNKRVLRFISKKYLEENNVLDKYKILVPAANGSSSIGEGHPTQVIGEPLIARPSFGFTGSFISVGKFSDEITAKACLKYVKSKFARVMLGTLKVTQHNPIETWSNVPLQDFTSDSDIDWSQSVSEIDWQLYKKYGLTKEEIAFIESMIKPME